MMRTQTIWWQVSEVVAYVEGHRPRSIQGYVVDNLSSEVVEVGEAHDLTDLLGVAFTQPALASDHGRRTGS